VDPVTIAIVAGLGAQIVGSVVGELVSRGDRETAERLLKEAAAAGNIPLPELERITAETLGPSAFEGLTTNPEYERAQLSALDRLAQIDAEGGMLLVDKANLNKVRGATARDANARAGAIRDDMTARGVGGSGAELAMRLSSNQAADQRSADAGLDIAAQAQERALDAIMGRADLAGKARGQEFAEKSAAAQAKDLISRYNADARSKANYYNAGRSQQQFGNQVDLARLKASGNQNLADYYSGESRRKRKMAGDIANAGGKAAGALGGYAGGGQSQGSDPDEWDNPYGGY
jgi:hypothetical protein